MEYKKIVLDNKCPNCGANIEFDSVNQRWKCSYCDSVFDDVKIFNKSNENYYEETKDYDQYECSNCGAVVIADKETVATHCAYCGNAAIIKNRLSGKFKPDKIIPFSTTKEDCIEEYRKLVKKSKFVSSAFKNSNVIDKIEGIYIPYWRYAGKTKGSIDILGGKDKDMVYSYSLYREAEEQYNIILDGSTNFDDKYTNAIEPFDYSKEKIFDKAYLSGFFAEKYNQSSIELENKVKKRMENTFIYHILQLIHKDGYSYAIDRVGTDSAKLETTIENVEYVLLPVWILTLNHKGTIYQFMMNGQTKKFKGIVPVSWTNLLLKMLLFSLIPTIIMMIYALLTSGMEINVSNILYLLPLLYIASFAVFGCAYGAKNLFSHGDVTSYKSEKDINKMTILKKEDRKKNIKEQLLS